MRRLCCPGSSVGSLLVLLQLGSWFPAHSAAATTRRTSQCFQLAYTKPPLQFQPNVGQTNSRVKFLTRGSGYSLFLTPQEAVLVTGSSGPRQAIRMRFAGSASEPAMEALDPLPGTTNFFLGSDPSKWRTKVPNYARVRYRNVYPGIDAVFYGSNGQLEYDFELSPGASPGLIQIAFEGTRKLRIDSHGDLILTTDSGALLQRKPIVYQMIAGKRTEIASRYVLHGNARAGFAVGAYDPNSALIIDPVVLSANTFPGIGYAIATDSTGISYVTGAAFSLEFPTTSGTLQPSPGGGLDVFIAKFDDAGKVPLYSTYLGGDSEDAAFGIAVDGSGNAYVSGATRSANFPTTSGSLQPASAGDTDAFVAKISPAGDALVYATYLGGEGMDGARSIALDPENNVYLTGVTNSAGFPVTTAAIQPALGIGDLDLVRASDAFVAKLDAAGAVLVYSTYLGGNRADEGLGIAVDQLGNAYIAGTTNSRNFLITSGVFQLADPLLAEGSENICAFASKLDPQGTLIYSTCLASVAEHSQLGIAVDGEGNAYIAGNAAPRRDFPTTPGAFQTTFAGGRTDGFVMKLDPTAAAVVYSTLLGGSGEDAAQRIVVDTAGNVYVAGYTDSKDFPTTSGAFSPALTRGFLTKLNAEGSQAIHSTFIDQPIGLAVDSAAGVYVTGLTFAAKIGFEPVVE